MINRRTFFSQAIALPPLVQASTATRRYQLTASKSNVSFADKGKETSLWLYNKTTPGPLLKARRGEIIEVEFDCLSTSIGMETLMRWMVS